MSVRVAVVTGMGSVSCIGGDSAQAFRATLEGQSGLQSGPQPLAGSPETIEAMVGRVADEHFAPLSQRFGRRQLGGVNRFATLAAVATLEALGDAGLLDHSALADAAILYGSSSGGNEAIEEGYQRLLSLRLGSVHPMTIPRMMSSAAASHLSMLFGIRGHCAAVASACASSAHAIADAMYMIRHGRADVVVTGGSDSSVTYGALHCWRDIQATSSNGCRPFSIDRNGTVIAEGAATLVIESEEHASARGARVLARIIGAGSSSDAGHITQPDASSAARAIRAALEDAGIGTDLPVLISAHGTGTLLNDRSEAEALRMVYGDALENCRVIATK